MKSLSFINQECRLSTHLGKCYFPCSISTGFMEGKLNLKKNAYKIQPEPIFSRFECILKYNETGFSIISENSTSSSEAEKLKRRVK